MAKKVEFNIELVKKLSFWVLVPLVLLLAFIFNLLAVSSLGKKFNERKKSLEGTKSSVEKIRQDKAHPNNNTIDDIKVHIEELRGRFVTAWATLEKEQRIRNVWPVDLGIPFIEEVSKLKFGDHISAASLELYLNFMNKCIPKLEAKLNRKRIQVNEGGVWKDKEGIGADTIRNIGRSNRSDSLANNNLEREEGIVEWPSPEIRNIMSSWALQPTSIEVWYAQEEFWVYDSLISLIEKSNSGASSTHSAVIKRIESMLIGQQASHELASRLSVQTMGGEGEGGMPSGSGARPAPPPSPPRAPGPGRLPVGEGMTGSDEESIGKSKRHERYVDANNVPLSADAASPFGEFNRMPICLRLIVDRQRIPDILVNCANSAMPIDVLSVRINPGAGGDANSRLGNTNQPSRPSGGRSGNIGGGGGGIDIGKQITMDGSSGLDSIYGPNAVPIEIYGCINIFNPVDQDIAQKAGKPTP
ncbi:MAG: hypothetical protein LBB88_02735 [Planctomycetaceae bacterium]|jgi:hypothetical protein|nr:hypothetical protein [Planctomycetaceae bacterium]